MYKRNRKLHLRKRLFVSALLLIFVTAISILTYAVLLKSDIAKEAVPAKTYFSELNNQPMEITDQVMKEFIDRRSPIKKPGTVTDVVKEEEPEVPEKDLSTMIANAKANVYTVYTDLEQGSGFLFNSKGDILTNAHVVSDSSYVRVKSSNGQEYKGEIIGISEVVDIALIRVPELAGKKPMEMELSKLPVATEVFAIGSPLDIANTSSSGKITATGVQFLEAYTYTDLYEMDAAIDRGSSGGPLIDAKTGKIIGMNSIVRRDNKKIGYAIPIYSIIDQLNKWVANPNTGSQSENNANEEVIDAPMNDEVMKEFIKDYYGLVIHSLNDTTTSYYLNYIFPESQAVAEGESMVSRFANAERTFKEIKPTIGSISIKDRVARIEMTADFMYQKPLIEETYVITHHVIYTVVIDKYGDYQIKNIETLSEQVN